MIGYGFVFQQWWLLAIGVVIAFFGASGWAIEPPTAPDSPWGASLHGGGH